MDQKKANGRFIFVNSFSDFSKIGNINLELHSTSGLRFESKYTGSTKTMNDYRVFVYQHG